MKGGLPKPLFIVRSEIKTPPMEEATRVRVGWLLRLRQEGEPVSMPDSRPMRQIDPRCHELRVREKDSAWRVIYSLEPRAVVVLTAFRKKSPSTPAAIKARARSRLHRWRSSHPVEEAR
jgi:phage-related protein